jgi:threonine/homoserine/homoserine lactone efflux protein
MIDPVILLAFVPAALALNLTPGADMMFCFGSGLKAGPCAGIAASAGVALGCMVHVTVAGAGLGAVVAASPVAFEVIRWLGVAYLLWLAVKVIRHAGEMPAAASAGAVGTAFRRGFVVNLTNPKVILFVLAFVPQFVDPLRPILPQFLILGGVISLGGFVVNGAVGAGAGGLGRRMARAEGVKRWLDRVTGAIFAGLALRLALGQR